MKKILFIVLLALSVVSCTKSNSNTGNDNSGTVVSAAAVPAEVKTAFAARYPNASGQIEWEKEDGNTYKVKFFLGNERWQAIFNANGSFVSEKKIK